jgi:hypothetical protein
MEDILVPLGFFAMVTALALGVPLVRSYTKRKELEAQRVNDDPESIMRLVRIESAIETLAVEIERISEGQRFTTRLLAERPEGAQPLVARAAEPVAAKPQQRS